MKAHQGSMEFSTKPGEGTEFILKIPTVLGAPSMTEQTYKPKVLVVDDEPQILESIHALLEDDFDVVVTTDATAAVEFLKNAQIAVILADQRMPKLTGGEFLAKAREICDATRILVTGYVDIDALIRGVNEGQIHSYVPKPWEPAKLKVTVLKAAAYAKEVSRRKMAAEILSEQQEALARSEAAYREQRNCCGPFWKAWLTASWWPTTGENGAGQSGRRTDGGRGGRYAPV